MRRSTAMLDCTEVYFRPGAASVRHKNRAATTVLVRGMSTDARHVALLPGHSSRCEFTWGPSFSVVIHHIS